MEYDFSLHVGWLAYHLALVLRQTEATDSLVCLVIQASHVNLNIQRTLNTNLGILQCGAWRVQHIVTLSTKLYGTDSDEVMQCCHLTHFLEQRLHLLVALLHTRQLKVSQHVKDYDDWLHLFDYASNLRQ